MSIIECELYNEQAIETFTNIKAIGGLVEVRTARGCIKAQVLDIVECEGHIIATLETVRVN